MTDSKGPMEQLGTVQTEAEGAGEAIDTGSYELLKSRLEDQAATLGKKAEVLNGRRIELFGGTELAIAGQDRIRTENNCLPRDMVSVGGSMLFGYNVFVGLRKETKVSDVFSMHRIKDVDGALAFEDDPDGAGGLLKDPRFIEDFTNLYRYFKDARLIHLRHLATKVLAVFQVGKEIRDVKVLRWAVTPGGIEYVDDRGDRDHTFPPSHDFDWVQTGREDFVFGKHPHVNIKDTVFVETVGGDLTVKVEDNTTDGWGIYREPVDDPDQSLDDGNIQYAALGTLILLKILPFGETTWRYLVFNTRSKDVKRIDAIGRACVQLPEDHGIIFPGGYYLQSGETKSFDVDTEGMLFSKMIKSPNGEDVLYVFYEEHSGRKVLLPYNLIRKEVQNPIVCNGYSLFDDGMMVAFRYDSEEPTRVHPVQIWKTPFQSDVYAAQQAASGERSDSYLTKVGNADLVRGISDCHSLRRLIQNQKPSMQIYEDLIAAAGRLVDAHYWLGHEEVGDLAATIREVLSTAELIEDEFEKVQAIQQAANEALKAAEETQHNLIKEIRPDGWTTVDPFVRAMDNLRTQRGKLITLKEMRYIDLARIEELEEEVQKTFEQLTKDVTRFLLRDDALEPYRTKYDELMRRIEEVKFSTEAVPIEKELETTSSNLDLLTEVVTGLQIEDPTARTRILEEISEVFALFNRAKATLAGRKKSILEKEGVAEFGAQFKLFAQAVQSALSIADTPEKCEEQLTRLMVQLEELEARFSEFDQFLGDLASKREEVYEAFEAKKQGLLDERQRRAENITTAADRILKGVGRRAQSFKSLDELNAYFAADAMVLKIRDLAEQLVRLGDSMRSEDVIARLKSARDDAARSLRDKTELFEEGENIIKLGKHRFSVNTQDLELTMLPRSGDMFLHLTGTEFYEKIEDEALEASRPFWTRSLVSESKEVYRGEYLAASILFDAEAHRGELTIDHLLEAQVEGRLLEVVRAYAAERYDEGYERGVHDHDATQILDKLLALRSTAGLLRYGPDPRGLACLFWAAFNDEAQIEAWSRTAQNLGRLRESFNDASALARISEVLSAAMAELFDTRGIECGPEDLRLAGEYLAEELATGKNTFVTSAEAKKLHDALLDNLELAGARAALEADLRLLESDLGTRFRLATRWFAAFVEATDREGIAALAPEVIEAAVLLLTESLLDREYSSALGSVEVSDLLGQHGRISDQTMHLRLDEFLGRLGRYRQTDVPAFRAFRQLRGDILERERNRLRLDEFKPRVLSSFVRNKLINDVYLPLIGDNLAKQIGAAGDSKRTDLMGMLLLISPPGYGKTTLMEYMANRLGLIFMKVNGPALGHGVTSLDPSEADNATARQELEKLNLALEMGNNVMLYLDDIQHTHPELLQKFISLCDAQRRIEGVWKGRTRTYDLRGKRFCVCMAGNPYTESGEKFQIPDMLANRADVYNLGDVLSGKGNAFAMSYIENSMTSNPILAPLATREQSDIYALIRMAQGEEVPTSEMKHSYSKVEQEEIISILKKLFACRDVLLAVNAQYIASAAQDDRFRTEPRFQLQGSYRNMNKLAEKVVSVMNERELEALIDDHYQGEAQTLTTGAEANLLKLGEMRGTQTEEERARWEEIKRGFKRVQLEGAADDDPVARVSRQIGAVGQHLDGMRDTLQKAAQNAEEHAGQTEKAIVPALLDLREALVKIAESATTSKPAAAPPPIPKKAAAAMDLGPYLKELNTALKTLADKQPVINVAAPAAPTAPPPPLPKKGKDTAAPAATAPDMKEYLDKLDTILVALTEQRPPVIKPVVNIPAQSGGLPAEEMARYLHGLHRVLAFLAQNQGKGTSGEAARDLAVAGLSPDQVKQLSAARNALRPLIELTADRVKSKKTLPASKVWKQLTEAMELLESIR